MYYNKWWREKSQQRNCGVCNRAGSRPIFLHGGANHAYCWPRQRERATASETKREDNFNGKKPQVGCENRVRGCRKKVRRKRNFAGRLSERGIRMKEGKGNTGEKKGKRETEREREKGETPEGANLLRSYRDCTLSVRSDSVPYI